MGIFELNPHSHIAQITKNELSESKLAPTNSSFEHCVWRTDSELAKTKNWTCPSEFFTKLGQN